MKAKNELNQSPVFHSHAKVETSFACVNKPDEILKFSDHSLLKPFWLKQEAAANYRQLKLQLCK